jgi:hypothetical protein
VIKAARIHAPPLMPAKGGYVQLQLCDNCNN